MNEGIEAKKTRKKCVGDASVTMTKGFAKELFINAHFN
jgi:hypothetical protein